ncbi:MAG: bis(5'-nucleosyl)-tetraphosphatase (symmetrical) YqeK [Lactobacillus sp.]|nr:bis(5'-nucleosyl)-tetraphosphatase (symmetrical) YqeK [Lactobacillus sp.]
MTKLEFTDTYCDLSSSELFNKVQSVMSEKRFKHSIGVSQTARKLAELNDYDPNKAALTGFLHDYAKEFPEEKFREKILKENYDPDLILYPPVWHGIVGASFVEEDLGIKDPEILTAIRKHTVGDRSMTTLDQIVFVADFIEPNRDFPAVDEARKVAFADLKEGMCYEIAHTIQFLVQKRQAIYPKMFEAYNSYVANKREI